MRLKPISKIESCPYCGDNYGYYVKYFVRGWINDITLFSRDIFDRREKENTDMWDGIVSKKIKPTCYCYNCKKAIGIDDITET